ncbi:MAG: tetratricopeptide repeat protein, partial [Pseudomonadota bacterium]|nr:tetratricopeptide repeat protein [Pseudomonadota bacterium]
MRPLFLSAAAGLTILLATATQAGWFLNQEQEAYGHLQAGDFEQAAAGFTDSYRRGVALFRAGRYQEAANAFSRVDRSAVQEDAHYNLGNARFKLGDYAGSVAAYEQVLSADPAHEDAQHNLTLARALLARLEQEAYEEEKKKQEEKEAEEQRKQEEEREKQEQEQEQQ